MSTRAFLPAVTEALVAAAPVPSDPQTHEQAIDRAAAFVECQIAALPPVLRTGLRVGLAAFRVYVGVRYLSGFCRLSAESRIAAVNSWASGSLTPCRQLFRPLRSLALLAYYEECALPPTRADRRTAAAIDQRAMQVGVLVVGSGAGGSVTALELADRGYDVLLVEEGDSPPDDPGDAGSTETMGALYRCRGMTPILGNVPIAYVEGRCVGGSTEINSGFWHRPPLEAVLRWKAQYDLAGASADQLRPHWEWAEQMLGVGLHQGQWSPSTEAFSRGARAMDWAIHEVPRTSVNARQSIIPRALASGARLLTGCRVEKLETTGGRVVAAVLRRRHDDGSTGQLRVEADHVFVCAGPTETPSLLRRSGVVQNVGNSLRIHPMLKLAALFKEDMGSDPSTMPLLQVKEFWPDIVLGGAYFSPGHLAVVLADNWAQTRGRMKQAGQMATYYIGARGTGRGRVRPSRLDPTRTEIRYELSDQDMWNLSRGLARLAALLLEGGAVEVLPAVHGLAAIRSEVDAVRWLDDRLDGSACSLTTVHAFSTCPMGERRDRCAADSFGKLHGFDNLYINDASMIPDSPGVNPQGTIMTFARRNALHFCDEHPA